MWYDLLESVLTDEFHIDLKDFLDQNGIKLKDLSTQSTVPLSTLYNIISNRTDYKISTFVKIINTIKSIENKDNEKNIGIITARSALDYVDSSFEYNSITYNIVEYPTTTIEEMIIQGIRAEREGMKGIICGPIAATTLQKIIKIPIISLRFEDGPIKNALVKLLNKLN